MAEAHKAFVRFDAKDIERFGAQCLSVVQISSIIVFRYFDVAAVPYKIYGTVNRRYPSTIVQYTSTLRPLLKNQIAAPEIPLQPPRVRCPRCPGQPTLRYPSYGPLIQNLYRNQILDRNPYWSGGILPFDSTALFYGYSCSCTVRAQYLIATQQRHVAKVLRMLYMLGVLVCLTPIPRFLLLGWVGQHRSH